MRRPSRLALVTLAALAGAVTTCAAGAGAGPRTMQADRPDVVFMTSDCTASNFLCPAFARAVKRTGARARIISPDGREDLVGTLSLLARQGHDLVMVDFTFVDALAEAAPRFPRTRFGLVNAPLAIVDGAPANVAAAVTRPNEASYLAGWLAARLERSRRGPDVVGVVGGEAIPPVQDFVIGFRAGARAGSPGVRVLTGLLERLHRPHQMRGRRSSPDRARRGRRVRRGRRLRPWHARRREGGRRLGDRRGRGPLPASGPTS